MTDMTARGALRGMGWWLMGWWLGGVWITAEPIVWGIVLLSGVIAGVTWWSWRILRIGRGRQR